MIPGTGNPEPFYGASAEFFSGAKAHRDAGGSLDREAAASAHNRYASLGCSPVQPPSSGWRRTPSKRTRVPWHAICTGVHQLQVKPIQTAGNSFRQRGPFLNAASQPDRPGQWRTNIDEGRRQSRRTSNAGIGRADAPRSRGDVSGGRVATAPARAARRDTGRVRRAFRGAAGPEPQTQMIRPPWIWSGGLQAPQSNVESSTTARTRCDSRSRSSERCHTPR
jgi:hypothetical protein